jgi:hypothetical protein
MTGVRAKVEAIESCPVERDEALGDLRFRALLGPAAWGMLPPAIRARFGHRLRGGAAVTYVGRIVESRATRAGALLAQVARLIGGPLPIGREREVAAVVTVTEDAAGDGQFWTRMYGRARGVPQVIHSSKRFAGPTGMEEYLGRGFGIALVARARADRLCFLSDHYFVRVGSWRLRLPELLSPGALHIAHVDRPDGGFAFELTLRHPRLGELIHQRGEFREHRAPDIKEIGND